MILGLQTEQAQQLVFDLFGDHDSDLVKIVHALLILQQAQSKLSVTTRIDSNSLFLRFLNFVDFDEHTLADLVMSDPEVTIGYMIDICDHVLASPIEFEKTCADFRHQFLSNEERNDAKRQRTNVTDYFGSFTSTFTGFRKCLSDQPPSTRVSGLAVQIDKLNSLFGR